MTDKKLDCKSMTYDELEDRLIIDKKTKAGLETQINDITTYLDEEMRAGRYKPKKLTATTFQRNPNLDQKDVKDYWVAWTIAHASDKSVYGKFVTKEKVKNMPIFWGKSDDELVQMDVLIHDVSKKIAFAVKTVKKP